MSVFAFIQDKVGSWYSNPGTGVAENGAAGGGVGKYLKARNAQSKSSAVNASLREPTSTKKRTAAGEFKDFSSW